MSAAANMEAGWHVGRKGTADEWKGGPYTWAQLHGYATEGRLKPDDLVWHPSMPDWVPASQIPGLMPTAPAPVAAQPAPEPAQPAAPAVPHVPSPAVPPVQPPAQPAPQPAQAAPQPAPQAAPAPQVAHAPAQPAPQAASAPQAAPAPPPPPRKTGRGPIIAIAAVVAALVLAGIGGGAWYFLRNGGFGGNNGPALGVAEVKVADPATHVQTEWGEAPPNQIGVVVAEGGKRKDAEKVASDLGGTVVGEVEFIGMYQIEFPGKTAGDLTTALDTAKSNEKIELAFPNGLAQDRFEIWGVREDPYEDPLYGGGVGEGLKTMGVSQAWSYIRGSGADLGEVHVGVVDDGLYAPGEGAESEFGGDVKVNYPDGEENAKLNGPRLSGNGSVNKAGSHGTGVATIIGADPKNGGPSGIAGPLGSKLTMSITNHSSGNYGVTTTTPDPNDPTKILWGNGVTYSLGNLVALQNQVDDGATVINCSWGADECHPDMAAAYKKFFEKMAAEKPGVIFVCAAGNTNKTALDNRTSFPCGHDLPNMLTVGAVDNDGKTASYSTIAGDNYVVDIAAPGTGAVVGMADGKPVQQNGTSFASPEVAAAAAMLKSLNPKLTAQQVKDILISTARTSIKKGDTEVAAEANVGGKILAIDQAVLKVINDVRASKGLPALTKELLEQMGVIDAVAISGDPGEYTVKGIVKAAGEKGTDVSIEVFAENNAIGGKTTQQVPGSGGEAKWNVTLPKDEGTVRVRRDDNGAASLITIEKIDINGSWNGSFMITDVTITDQEAAEEEGCAVFMLEGLMGKAMPMTMDVTVDESGQGTAISFIDPSKIDLGDGEASSEPQTWGVSYSGGHIEFSPQASEGISGISADVARRGDAYVMMGTMTGGGAGWTMTASFTLNKPAPPK